MKKILNFFKKDRKTELDVGPLHLYWGTDQVDSQKSKKRAFRLHIFFHKKARLKFLVLFILIIGAAPFVHNYFFKTDIANAADTFIQLNEGYGTSANDTIGTVSAGTIAGAIWRQEEFCRANKCLYFDGSGDKVTYADDSDLDFVAADDFTITGWFRHPEIASNPDYLIVKHESGTAGGYKVYMDSDGDLVFGVDDDGTWDTADIIGDDQSKNFDDNKWHHFSAQKDGTTGIYLYVDGNLIDQDTSLAETGTLANAASFFIGIDSDGSSNAWSGFIDEIKVYRSLRTAAEIKADFLGSTPSRGTGESFGPNQEYISNGLIGYWKMDESSGNPADSSGNGYTLTNNGTTTFTTGKFANGSLHNGTTQYFSSATLIGSIRTTSFWVNPASNSDNYIHFGSGVYINSSSGTVSLTGITAEAIYVNGILNGTITASTWNHVVVIFATLEAEAFEIARANGSYLSNNGKMDEIRIYNRALSPAEVSKLYNFAPGPVLYINLNENTGTTAQDSSSYGSTGTFYEGTTANSSGPTWTTGKFGSSASFTGTNDVIRIPENSSTDFGATTDSYTVSAWFNTTTGGTNQAIVSKYANTGLMKTFQLRLNSSNFGCFDINDSGGINREKCNSTALNDGNWHHIAGVRDVFNDFLYLYIDGVVLSISDNTTATTANNDDISIGANDTNYNGSDFTGRIDEVKIYNYARSSAQIIEDMNAGHPAPGSPVGSPVGYWKMDEGYSTTSYDNSINANNLTLSTASWTNDGKFQKAWNGTGSNPHLSRTDDADFDFSTSEDFSLSAWVRSDSTANPGASEFIIDKQVSGNNPGYRLYFNTSGQLVCDIDDDTTSFPEDSATGTTDYYDLTWHHVVCIRDIAADKLNLYVDGNLHTQDTDLSATGDLSNADSLTVGAQDTTDGGTDDFSGDIDEVKVYRSALDANQIKVEFNRGSMVVLGAVGTDSSGNPSFAAQREYCPPGNTDTNCGGSNNPSPVGEWKLDENTGLTAYDTSVNANNGTISTTSNPPSWYPAKRGAGLSFPGTGGGGNPVSMGDPAGGELDFDASSSFTYQLWVYSYGSIGAFDKPIWKGGTAAGTPGYMMELGSGPWQANLADASAAFSANFNSSSTNTWYLLTAVVDQSENLLKTYQNGVFQASTDISSMGTLVNSSNFLLGSRDATAAPFFGIVDDVKVYNYVRTPAQITWDYNHSGPVLWLKLDENSGTTANDSSGNAASYTLNSSSYTTGKFNYAHNGTGTSTWIAGTDDPLVDFTATQDFSVSMWFKSDSATNPSAGSDEYLLVDGRPAVSPNGIAGYYIYFDDSGFVNFAIDDDTNTGDSAPGTPSPDDFATTTSDLYDNNWHHLVAVKTSNTRIDLYIDGNLTSSDTSITATGSLDNGTSLKVGDNNADNPNSFRGDIDEVQVYRFGLSTQQIKLLFNNGAAYRVAPVTGTP